MKTNITGPYDLIDRDDMVKVTCQIPETTYFTLFHQMFTRRGAQDRILAALIDWFHQQCLKRQVPTNASPQNEHYATSILNQLQHEPRQPTK